MNITPVRDQIFCKIMKIEEEQRKGLIIVPNQDKAKGAKIGKVIAIGDGKMFPDQEKLMTFNLEIGDCVIVNNYAGVTISDVTGDYLLVSYNEITGVWHDFEKGEENENTSTT